MELITNYFPGLTEAQIDQLSKLPDLYSAWNDKINVISRKDIENFKIRHLLHSLSIGKFISFKPGTKCMDLGTGGGLPGIPLAVLFPEVEFLLVDGTGKKIKVANEIINELGLKNCKGVHSRAEDVVNKFDFVLARAVTRLKKLLPLTAPLIKNEFRNVLPNGLIALKGGNLEEELNEVNAYREKVEINRYFSESFFTEKYIVYVPIF